MRVFRSKKRVAVLLALVVVAISAVAAYAYFTTAGSGSGNVVSGQVGAINITNDTPGTYLYPQTDSSQTTPLAVHVNNTGGGTQFVGQITGTVADQAGCSGSWFTVASISAPGRLTPGNHDFASSIVLNDINGDQSACANKTLTINWVSAAG